jgi:hypothetical protein
MEYNECAMRALWGKTAKLLLRYPILWLPYVCADLLNRSFELVRRAASTQVLYWLSIESSVLGGTPSHLSSEVVLARAFWISGVMEWSLRYLTIYLDTAALVATAVLVTMIARGEQLRFRAVLAELWKYPNRILAYSFKLYLLVLLFAIFVSVPALRLLHLITDLNRTAGWSRAASFALTQGQSLVSLILFAWIMTPIKIRLMRAPGAEPPSYDEKRLGRYFMILTGFGAFALSASLFPLLFKLVAFRPFPDQVYAMLVSLVLSCPFIVLGAIGVALIADGGDWNLGEPSAHRRWSQLVGVLMPLHFDEGEEH